MKIGLLVPLIGLPIVSTVEQKMKDSQQETFTANDVTRIILSSMMQVAEDLDKKESELDSEGKSSGSTQEE